MNVQASKDLAVVTALYEFGEVPTYTALVDKAAAAAAAVAALRSAANCHWGNLLAAGENPAAGVESFVYEIAAGEFVGLANFCIEDFYTLAPPAPAGYAALYITGYVETYETLADTAQTVYKNLAAVGRRALLSGDSWAAVAPPVAAAYRELAARIAAELGEYTYGATALENVRTELAAV